MSEETFGLVAVVVGAFLVCGMGALVLCLPLVDRLIEWWKKKRA